MKAWAKWAIALMAGIVAAVAARQLVATVFVVRGNGMSPTFVAGDRVLVNRWSYGLRTGGSGTLFSYGRLLRQKVSIGDYIAYEDPRDNTGSTILFGRCQALPGDTLTIGGKPTAVPSLKHCADADCYYVTPPGQDHAPDPSTTGFVSEELIIGRVCIVICSHNPEAPVTEGWRMERTLMTK